MNDTYILWDENIIFTLFTIDRNLADRELDRELGFEEKYWNGKLFIHLYQVQQSSSSEIAGNEQN